MHYIIKKILFLFLLLFSFVSPTLQAQQYHKYPIVNYTPNEYGKNQNRQTWAVTQTKEGLIYAASNNGLIEYDGSKWNVLFARVGFVYSVACDSNNTLFVGGENYFGCYLKDSIGKLYYEPLSENLPERDHEPITRVWRTFAGKDRIYFQTNECLYVYDYKTIKTIKPVTGTSFHICSFVDNTLYIRERGKGLMKCVNDKLEFIPNSQMFAEYGFFGMLPFDEKKQEYLVVTQELGFFIYNRNSNKFSKYAAELNPVWFNAKLFGGMQLKNGSYVFNSQFSGALLFDPKTEEVSYINTKIGLQDDDVTAQFEDNTGNLWLASHGGLSKINIRSPLQAYSSMHGAVLDITTYNGKLYAATSKGIFVKSPGDHDFVRDPGFSLQIVRQLAQHDNKLYLISDVGLYEYDGKKYSRLLEGSFSSIKFLRNGKILVGGTSGSGLRLFSENFKKEEYDFAIEIPGGILGIEEEKSDDSHVVYWASTPNSVYRITDDGSDLLKIDTYSEEAGMPNDWKCPFLFQNKVVIGNGYGLFELIKDSSGASFEPVNLYNLESSGHSFTFLKDVPEKTLAIIDNFPHLIDRKEKTDIYVPFLRFGMENPSSLYYADKKLYICGETGLIVFDERKYAPENSEFNVVIRKITTKNDSVLFDGATISPIRLGQSLIKTLNDLTIEVSSNYLNLEESTVYRYKLEGIDTSFSAWQTERKIKLYNLYEGKYKLIIQAKNINEKISRDAIIEFRILPPWYRTTLAYILYVVGFILFVYLAVKIASYRLQQQNKQLDELVKKRTKEIEHKNEELKEQNVQILHQKQEITDSINYAKRIQNAILPPLTEIKSTWPDTFVFFQPKDIVSGDFYWFHKISEQEFLIACADCTGHGVPGGFMSMVCSDKLNEAVAISYEPGEILKRVNIRIKQSLRQDNREGSTKDGMEIALLRVNRETRKLTYAGANRFLWIIRNGSQEVEEIKPTKAGIGGYTEDSQEFAAHEVMIGSGDRFYMSTDGYGDQFGGGEGKKLMTKSFKQFLVSIKDLLVAEQGQQLEQHINGWKGQYEQVDDILVIGLRF